MEDHMHWFTFIVLSIIFIASPYSKGLYFISDFYGISIIIGILAFIVILRILLYKESWKMKTVGLVFLLPISYLLPLYNAVSVQEAGETVIRWITYALFFFTLYWATNKEDIKRWMPIVLQVTGIWMSIYMLLVTFGWVSSEGMYVSERFAGVLQYPNTYAMITGIFYLFSLVMVTQLNGTRGKMILYSLPLVIFLVCFIQTYSRGMYLVLPVAWFVGLMLLSTRKQLEYILHSLISICLALLVLQVGVSSTGMFVIVLFSLSFLQLVLVYMIKKYGFITYRVKLDRWISKKWAQFLIPLFIIMIGIFGMLDIRNQGLVYHSLPSDFQERVSSISLQANTAKERFIFVEDAFRIVEESPIIGHGGGGWKTLYKTYQQGPYLSNKIHNGYMEWLVDTGWIGLSAFVFVFGYYLYSIVSRILKDRENTIQIAVVTGLVIVFVHSFIDFNFSYGTVWFVVFWLFTMGLSLDDLTKRKEEPPVASKLILVILVGMVLLSGYYSYKNLQASRYFSMAKKAETIELKEKFLERAVSLSPQNTTYVSNLIDMELKLVKNKREIQGELIEHVDQLLYAAPNNSNFILKAALVSEDLGETEKAFELYEKALKLDHYNTKIYEASMRFKNRMALTNQLNKEFYATSVLVDYKEILKWEKVVIDSKLPVQFNSRDFKVTSKINYQAGMAYFILGKFQKVIEIYASDLEKPSNLSALTSLAYERLGGLEEAEKIVAVSEDQSKIIAEKEKLEQILLK